MSIRRPLAQPVMFVDFVEWDDVLGDHKLGERAGVAAWLATSLAEAKPDSNVHVAPLRSRWAVRFCFWEVGHEKSRRAGVCQST